MTIYTKPPATPQWIVPEWLHSEYMPFCQHQDCACHFQTWRVDTYIVQPIERGLMTIGQAVDLMKCREGVAV